MLDGPPGDALDEAIRLAPNAKGCGAQRRLLAQLQFAKDRALYWEHSRHWGGWADMRARIKSTPAIEAAVGTSLNYWMIVDAFDGTLASFDRLLQAKGRAVRIFVHNAPAQSKIDAIELSAETVAEAPAAGDAIDEVDVTPGAPNALRRRATAFVGGVAKPYTYAIDGRTLLFRGVDGAAPFRLDPPRLSDWQLQIPMERQGVTLSLSYASFANTPDNYVTVDPRCPAGT